MLKKLEILVFLYKLTQDYSSTQDIGVIDQATIVLRYVHERAVEERLFSVLPVSDSTGRGLNELIQECFRNNGIIYENITGELFDGAANMRSKVKGLRAHISRIVKDNIYIWCYSHALNLCVCDTCDILEAKNLFGLLNRVSTFFSESHKRMNVWRNKLSDYSDSKKPN